MRRKMLTLALAGVAAGSALTGCASAGPMLERARVPLLPAKVRLATTHAVDLASGKGLPVLVQMKRTGSVRVAAVLVTAAGKRARLGASRSLRLQANRVAGVTVPLTAAGRAALAACPPGRIELTVTNPRLGRPLTTRSAIRVAPPACGRFFGRAAIWNAPLARDAPLDPDSAAVTQDLLKKVNAAAHGGLPPTIATSSYAPPVYTVPRNQPRVRVALDPDDDPALAASFNSVPLPPWARPAPGSDSELVVWQPSTDTLWEFWQLRRTPQGWHANWGGRLDRVSTGPGHYTEPHPSWGTTATSLPLVGGMMTPRELATGRIEHALSMAVPGPRASAFSRPAQRTDGMSACRHAVPEGARFRLDPNLDIGALRLAPPVAAIARAAQKYGIYIRDQADSVTLYAQSSVSLPADPYPAIFGGRPAYELLQSFPWTRLQLTQMQLVQTGRGSTLEGLLQGC